MKMLQIGLGSMGKRRIRNLHALGYKDIIGFDIRDDRRKEAVKKYSIKTVERLTPELLKDREVYIISTPPDQHNVYMKTALQYKKPAFVEASVIREGLLAIAREAKRKNVPITPSCTSRFHPAVKIIKKIVDSRKYGKICNFSHTFGQYLPDWHPWEDIKDYYVSKRETGGGRETVSFEMTWILDITGMPTNVFSFRGNTIDLGVDIDDSYAIALKFKDFFGVMLVDVVSRFATKTFFLNLERANIRWNWEDRFVSLYDAKTKKWHQYDYSIVPSVAGYNPNTAENMYIEELNVFLRSLRGGKKFPNTLEEDALILKVMEECERSSQGRLI
jgi:predicted dehydrogenase